jgi:hypothetical protein
MREVFVCISMIGIVRNEMEDEKPENFSSYKLEELVKTHSLLVLHTYI